MKYRREYLVTPERAAANAMAHLHAGVSASLTGLTAWRGANLGTPATIYDLNGQPLFYDFPVMGPDGGSLGTVRASAATALGEAVASVSLGPARWHPSRATLAAIDIVTHQYRGVVLKTLPVCYAYPKLGILVEWKKSRGTAQQTVFDAADLSVVPAKVAQGLRGPGAVSVYESIPEASLPAALQRFASHEKVVAEVEKRSKLKLAERADLAQFEKLQSVFTGTMLQFTETRRLTFCTHAYSHECFFLHGQSNGYYCVVATGQMLLDFWRFNFTQPAIATAMGTTTGGTGYAGEVSGYESLTNNHFDATHDTTPTFGEAKTEIQANRPFDYSYSYHAMACAGYSEQKIYLLGTTPLRQVYLYDPSPVSTGLIRWETWGAGWAAVDGFVYLRRA